MLSLRVIARGWTGYRKPGKSPRKLGVSKGMRRAWTGLLAGLMLAIAPLLGGCASAPASPEALAANDPFEPFNRAALKRNAVFDRYLINPTLNLYFLVVPEPGRRGVRNFLGNLSLPTIFVNDLLQGEASRAGHSVWRLVINSTLGLGGFLDPASKVGIPRHGEDFGQTLAVWGVGEGPYLVLPFIGPSNPRDATGMAADLLIDPTNHIPFKQHIWWDAGRIYFTLLDLKGQSYETLQGIQRNSVDYYSSLRSLYRQMRAEQIRNGRKTAEDLPDF
jgi:phospholipid-binding lipoprotein MlaA